MYYKRLDTFSVELTRILQISPSKKAVFIKI